MQNFACESVSRCVRTNRSYIDDEIFASRIVTDGSVMSGRIRTTWADDIKGSELGRTDAGDKPTQPEAVRNIGYYDPLMHK